MNCKTALILAAGRGERLRPITDSIPKPLIQIGKFRLIEYHIFNLAKSGIKTIYINRAHLREQFDKLLPADGYLGVKLAYFDEPDGALETAGAIINAFSHLDDEKLLVINGDIWCDYNLNKIRHLPSNPETNAHIILVPNPEHNLKGDFSIKGNKLDRISQGLTSYTFSGIGVYRRSMFTAEDVGFKKLAPLLNQQITKQQITASIHDGEWMDIGTVERLESLRKKLG